MSDTPSWRQAYDTVERQIGPRLEELLRSEQFAVAVGLMAKFQRNVEAEAGRMTRRVLHRLNLPAGSDVSRILNEIGQLRRQVGDLQSELADTQAALADAEVAKANLAKPARARSAATSPRAKK